MDKLLKVEEIIDGKQDRINALEKELARKNDEVECRKEVIESMSSSMMKHEKENRELVSKLVMLKNQILENDIGQASDRHYGAVKVQVGSKKVPPIPVSVSSNYKLSFQFKILKEKNEDYFFVIDSRQFEAQINFESIEEIEESEDKKLCITYLTPTETSNTL